MTRYTKKNDGTGSWTYNTKYIPAHNIKHKQCVDKLGELEDIEEGFGIDLIKLLTAEEIYYKANGKIESHSFDVDFSAQLILIRIYHSPYPKDTECFTFGFNSYGKTWALARKELEK